MFPPLNKVCLVTFNLNKFALILFNWLISYIPIYHPKGLVYLLQIARCISFIWKILWKIIQEIDQGKSSLYIQQIPDKHKKIHYDYIISSW